MTAVDFQNKFYCREWSRSVFMIRLTSSHIIFCPALVEESRIKKLVFTTVTNHLRFSFYTAKKYKNNKIHFLKVVCTEH